jgi:poly(hydroxyalkanoate) depolymerase family esterase
VPRGFRRLQAAPLIVLLHGCRQTADELARGTRIAALADETGALVLMPQQDDDANPYRCWNWFDRRTSAGKGESAIVAAMIRKILRRWRIDRSRVFVGGMSAGAALAAVLGLRHPDLVRAVVAHSGLACGAAASPFTALSVMRRGAETDVAAIGRDARSEAATTPRVPLLVVQGLDDDVVAARHGAALARQYLAFNGIDVPSGADTLLPPPDRDEVDATLAPYVARTREWSRDGRPLVRLVEVAALGHGWSGGDDSLPYHHAGSPSATALLARWLTEASGSR